MNACLAARRRSFHLGALLPRRANPLVRLNAENERVSTFPRPALLGSKVGLARKIVEAIAGIE